jgi:lysophospholipase L1-like esterase
LLSRRRLAVFGLITLAVFFALIELVLRVLGFHYVPVPFLLDKRWGPHEVQAMNKGMNAAIFRQDDLLFWSFIPGAALAPPDSRKVNELGLLSAPVAVPKPAGTVRILCLGDSCTALGPAPYAGVLERRLQTLDGPGRRFQVVNGGCFGYTSLQGLRLFRDRLPDLQADLVTIYFGWNDHYLTPGYPEKMLRARDSRAPAPIRAMRHVRLYQLVRFGVMKGQLLRTARVQEREGNRRVASEDYRANLSALIDTARRRDARVLLLTAPDNLTSGKVPAFYAQIGLAKNEADLIESHRRYNDIVRAVSKEKSVDLLDLADEWNGQNKDTLFINDCVHPNAYGCAMIGARLAERLGEIGFLAPDERRRLQAMAGFDSLAPHRLRSRIEFAAPLRAAAGKPFSIPVCVTNTGDTLWLAHSENFYGHVRVGIRVVDAAGREILGYGATVHDRLPRDVRPGETVSLSLSAPALAPGRYELEADPVDELICWFNNTGDERSTATLIVESADAATTRSEP